MKIYEIQISASLNLFWNTDMPMHLHVVSGCCPVASFLLQGQSRVIEMETVWPEMPKVFTVCPLQQKFFHPCSKR